MNEDQNVALAPAVERRLRVAVERIVRPVHAGELRKLRMRRELFAHALEAYAAETPRHANEDEAVAAVVQRMGVAAEVTSELQASVSLADRWSGWVEWATRRRRNGPYAQHAAWMALFCSGLIGVQLVLVSATISLLAALGCGSSPSFFGPAGVRTMLFVVVTSASIAALGALCGGRVRDRLEATGNRITPSIVGLALSGGVTMWLIGLLTWQIAGAPAVVWSADFAIGWGFLSAFFAAATVIVSSTDLRERREIEPWLELELD